MPKLHDFRSDFRKGRTGQALRAKPQAQAYVSGLFDCLNMMVVSDGSLKKRWGTIEQMALAADTRIESWIFSAIDTERFILMFQPGKLLIYDMTLTLRATIDDALAAWDATTMRYLQITSERNKLIITDQTFQPVVVTLNVAAATFSHAGFEFEISEDDTRISAPFFQFADRNMKFTLKQFSSQYSGWGSGLPPATESVMDLLLRGIGGWSLPEAGGSLIGIGSSYIETEEDFFIAEHVGQRLRALDGEMTVTEVVSPTEAKVIINRDMAVRLDPNPLYLRKNSKHVEVTLFDHGIEVGEAILLSGLTPTDEAKDLLVHAPLFTPGITSAPAPSGGGAVYIVQKVNDKDTFEIEATQIGSFAAVQDAPGENLYDTVTSGAGMTVPTNDALAGGADIYLYRYSYMRRLKEVSFGPHRGWPQACTFHERRLWFGGTEELPDAAWGSKFSQPYDFDTDDGSLADAIEIYGLGEQARIRHIVSDKDLLFLTDGGEYYIAALPDEPLSQGTIRVTDGTKHGAAYTVPRKFDGGTLFVDAVAQHVREMRIDPTVGRYAANPVTVVCPDWVQNPDDSCIYRGSTVDTTPYLFFVNELDGAMMVMHSQQSDDMYGFMRWALSDGDFISVTGVGNRLFAVAKKNGAYKLLEFDTTDEEQTCLVDFGAKMTGNQDVNWLKASHADRTCSLHVGKRVYSDVVVDNSGAFVTPEPLDYLCIGDRIPWFIELNAPVAATGQGSKMGKSQRIVDCEISWINTTDAVVEGQPAQQDTDKVLFEAPTPINEWREYQIGKWGREPVLRVEGDDPGTAGCRAITMNVYV